MSKAIFGVTSITKVQSCAQMYPFNTDGFHTIVLTRKHITVFSLLVFWTFKMQSEQIFYLNRKPNLVFLFLWYLLLSLLSTFITELLSPTRVARTAYQKYALFWDQIYLVLYTMSYTDLCFIPPPLSSVFLLYLLLWGRVGLTAWFSKS